MTAWWKPSKPTDIKPIPWLSPEATQYLDSIIQPDFEIIEHGSGGSTLWFAERCKSVISYEPDSDWQAVVKKQAPNNVLVMTPKAVLIPYGNADLLLIDGEPVENRAEWILMAAELVKPGGWVVLDNANRPEYATQRKTLKRFADLMASFDGNEGHHLYLVTEFWKVRE